MTLKNLLVNLLVIFKSMYNTLQKNEYSKLLVNLLVILDDETKKMRTKTTNPTKKIKDSIL